MIVSNRNNKLVLSVMVVGISLALFFFLIPYNSESIYQYNYTVNAVCLIICMLLYINLIQIGSVDLFSTCTIFSVLYFTMFFVTPIYDIIAEEYLWFGINLFDQGVKGSLFALLGYLSFYIVMRYNFTFGYNLPTVEEELDSTNVRSIYFTNRALLFVAVGYIVCLMANIYYLVSSGGNSVIYILTLGVVGNTGNATAADIGAISMLSYALPSFTLLYFELGKNRVLKIISFLLMFELQVARGFRFFILQIAIMFGVYYYLRNNKRPKFHQIVLLCALILIPLIIMTLFRNSIRTGAGIDMSVINGEALKDALEAVFWDNLRIYKNYYALLKVVPYNTPFLFGAQTIVYTGIMLIPRAIWPSKPGNPGTIAQGIALGSAAVNGGSAYPALGEYYYDFGIIGILFWMTVWGIFLKKIEARYRIRQKSVVDLMIYCTALGTILQFTIRGYMPSNFWMLVFCMIPFWMMKKFFMRSKLF